MNSILKRVESHKDFKYSVLVFTGIHIVLFLFVVFLFRSGGKSLLLNGDGRIQEYPLFVQQITQIKNTLGGIFRGDFVFETYDFNAGFGMDRSAYSPRHFLTVLGIFVPSRFYYNFYIFCFFLMSWIAGVSVILFCEIIDIRNTMAQVVASLIYIYSGFCLYSITRYMSFTSMVMYFALVTIGLENVLRGKRKSWFIISLFMVFYESWYWGYVVSILSCVYTLIRLSFIYYESKNIKEILTIAVRTFVAALEGVLLSAISWLPGICAFFVSCRGEQKISEALWAYSSKYYIDLLLGFLSPNVEPNFGLHKFFLPISILGIIGLFVVKKSKKSLQILICMCICFLFAMIPFFGKLFNGGGYVTNRWAFALPYVLAIATAYVLSQQGNFSESEKHTIINIMLLYDAVYIVFSMRNASYQNIVMGCILISQILLISKLFSNEEHSYTQTLLNIGFVVFSILISSSIIFSSELGTYIYRYSDYDVNSMYNNNYMMNAKEIDDDGFYRVGTPWNETCYSQYYGYNGTNVYCGLNTKEVTQFFEELEMNTARYSFQLAGLDDRRVLNSLFDVKYYLCSGTIDDNSYQLISENQNGKVYELSNSADAFFSPAYIDGNEYDTLNSLQKMDALSQGIVLRDKIDFLTKTSYKNNFSEAKIHEIQYEGIEEQDGTYVVQDDGGKIILKCSPVGNCETYVKIDGINIISGKSEYRCRIKANENNKEIDVLNTGNHYYHQSDFTVNLGYSTEGYTEISIEIPNGGKFSIDSISVWGYYNIHQSDSLKMEGIDGFSFDEDCLSGQVDIPETGLLQVSVPYSSGWSAYVDGEKTDVFQTDTMFMSILVDKGQHIIQWRYTSPGKIYGTIISVLTLLWLCFEFILYRKRTVEHK